jgi:GTPase SAR1 family protein
MSWDFREKKVQLGEGDPNSASFKPTEMVRLFVWDTAGQERFRQIARMYYNDCAGVLVCFDLTDEESFSRLNFWL